MLMISHPLLHNPQPPDKPLHPQSQQRHIHPYQYSQGAYAHFGEISSLRLLFTLDIKRIYVMSAENYIDASRACLAHR